MGFFKMSFENKVAVIIPTFNRKEVTTKCINTLLNNTVKPDKIIVCDSGSIDGTREAVASFSEVTVLNVGSESWWSAAVNRGLEFVLNLKDFDYALIINDDINFQNNLLELLLTKANNYPGKIISPAQTNIRGTFLGIKFKGIGREHCKIWVTTPNESLDVESTNGCCLLIPIDTFKKIGLFNEKYCPHLFGDTEFQLRAWNRGIATRAVADVVIGQQADTEYFRRQKLLKLLTFPASPVHLKSYLAYGKALFHGSFLMFLFFGFKHHRAYVFSFLKTIYIVIKQNFAKSFGTLRKI